MKFIYYDIESGRILSNNSRPGSVFSNINSGKRVMKGSYDPKLFYVLDGVVIERPVYHVDVLDNTIFGVIEGSEIKVNTKPETVYLADGSKLDFTFDTDHEYIITISLWPYRDIQVKLNGY